MKGVRTLPKINFKQSGTIVK